MDQKTVGLIALSVGALFAYAGIRGYSIQKAAQNVIKGESPSQAQDVAALVDPRYLDSGGGQAVSGSDGEKVLQKTAAQFGWGSGQQWQAFRQLAVSENSTFNTHEKNPSTGALGIAQALGHGTSRTRGTLGNEYGNFGLSDAQNKAANSGDAGAQSLWMCHYIKATYGDPIKAWAFHQRNNWY
jgi:hypothetical protein